MRLIPKIGLFIFILISSLGFLVSFKQVSASDIKFSPQVSIPGSTKFVNTASTSISKDGEGRATTETLAEYLKAIYTYAISIVGIVATVMLMVGGFIWLTAGGSGEKVGKARDIIFSSLTGLVLALTSYTILSVINPDLVNFNIIELSNPLPGAAGEILCIDSDNDGQRDDCADPSLACVGFRCVESSSVIDHSQQVCTLAGSVCPPPWECGPDGYCFDPTPPPSEAAAATGCCLSSYNQPTSLYLACSVTTFEVCNTKSDGFFSINKICDEKSGPFGSQKFECK